MDDLDLPTASDMSPASAAQGTNVADSVTATESALGDSEVGAGKGVTADASGTEPDGNTVGGDSTTRAGENEGDPVNEADSTSNGSVKAGVDSVAAASAVDAPALTAVPSVPPTDAAEAAETEVEFAEAGAEEAGDASFAAQPESADSSKENKEVLPEASAGGTAVSPAVAQESSLAAGDAGNDNEVIVDTSAGAALKHDSTEHDAEPAVPAAHAPDSGTPGDNLVTGSSTMDVTDSSAATAPDSVDSLAEQKSSKPTSPATAATSDSPARCAAMCSLSASDGAQRGLCSIGCHVMLA